MGRKLSLISPISSSSSSSSFYLRGFCCFLPSTIAESRTCNMISTGFFLSFANTLQSINNKFLLFFFCAPTPFSFDLVGIGPYILVVVLVIALGTLLRFILLPFWFLYPVFFFLGLWRSNLTLFARNALLCHTHTRKSK